MNEKQRIARTVFFEKVFVKNGWVNLIRDKDGLMMDVEMGATYYDLQAMGCPYCDGNEMIIERRNPNAFTMVNDSETGKAHKAIFHGFLCASCAQRSAKLISAEGHVISFGWSQ